MLVLVLVAMACSEDTSPAPPEVFTPADGAGGTDLTDPDTTLVPPDPQDPPEIQGPTLADFDVPCGRDAEPPADATIGVDDEVIRIGTGNDVGARFAGSGGAGMPEAVAAMADHCSSLGGLAGRGLTVESYDAAVVEATARAQEQCGEVVAVVGAGYASVSDARLRWDACRIPVFSGWPDWLFVDQVPVEAHRFVRFAEPDAGSVVAVVVPDTDDGAAAAERLQFVLGTDGFVVATVIDYPLTLAPNWDDIAAEIIASGAGMVHLEGPCADATVPLLTALGAAAEAPPVVITGPSSYHPSCVAAANRDGVPTDRLLVQVPFLPLEDGDDAPVTMAFAEILATYAAEVHGDALLASAAFWSFAVAVDGCAERFTRGCLAAETDGDGAGLIRSEDAACRVVLGVVDGGFERILPDAPGTLACPA